MLWETALLSPSCPKILQAGAMESEIVIFTAIAFASNCTRYIVFQFLDEHCSFILY